MSDVTTIGCSASLSDCTSRHSCTTKHLSTHAVEAKLEESTQHDQSKTIQSQSISRKYFCQGKSTGLKQSYLLSGNIPFGKARVAQCAPTPREIWYDELHFLQAPSLHTRASSVPKLTRQIHHFYIHGPKKQRTSLVQASAVEATIAINKRIRSKGGGRKMARGE